MPVLLTLSTTDDEDALTCAMAYTAPVYATTKPLCGCTRMWGDTTVVDTGEEPARCVGVPH